MIVIAILAGIAAQEEPPKAIPLSSITVAARIIRPAPATAKDWQRTDPTRRREVIVQSEKGQTIVLRLIEHE
ncbi:MAG: hypothetical protein ABIR25_07785, partial [Sphingomicrobium sp.]